MLGIAIQFQNWLPLERVPILKFLLYYHPICVVGLIYQKCTSLKFSPSESNFCNFSKKNMKKKTKKICSLYTLLGAFSFRYDYGLRRYCGRRNITWIFTAAKEFWRFIILINFIQYRLYLLSAHYDIVVLPSSDSLSCTFLQLTMPSIWQAVLEIYDIVAARKWRQEEDQLNKIVIIGNAKTLLIAHIFYFIFA